MEQWEGGDERGGEEGEEGEKREGKREGGKVRQERGRAPEAPE